LEKTDLKEKFDTLVLRGIGASPGLICGTAFIHYEKLGRVTSQSIQSKQVKSETARLDMAIAKSKKGLEALRKEARKSVGADLSKILDAQMMIFEDEDFMSSVRRSVIKNLQNVEYAFQQEANKTIRALSRSKDEYIREMVSDINSVAARMLHNLSGINDSGQRRSRIPLIGFASIFSPDEIMNMRKSNMVGFVTENGGPTSHMVLIAKALGIPAVVGVKDCLDRVRPAQNVTIDGRAGEVVIAPSPGEWNQFRRRVTAQKRRDKRQFEAIGKLPSKTLDGHYVEISANLEVPTPFDQKLVDEGIGVGLYRTEFLYLKSSVFPDEEEQFEVYSNIVKQFNPLTVTLRTFDLGGDKFTEHFKNEGEANPALGWRAIRFSLDVPKIFRTQLRAMLRASAFGKVQIMFPMISCVEQIVRVKRTFASVKRNLRKDRIPFDEDIQIGIMIEIPSAVMIAHRLALEVDFFSIGTNDLTQYTLAVDRGNARVAKWYRQYHPAVLRFIAQTIEAGHENNIPVNICGELAGDARAARLLIGLGVDCLSTSPRSLHAIKEIISQINYSEAKSFAQEILYMQSAASIEQLLSDDYYKQFKKPLKGR
jgi:phosphotransferase system enzyme I (PtsI)